MHQAGRFQYQLFNILILFQSFYQSDSLSLASGGNYACSLPIHPRDGKWIVSNPSNNSTLRPGQRVPELTVLNVQCQKNHKNTGNATILCVKGKWSSSVGPCIIRCRPIYNTATTKATCTYPNKHVGNCTEPYHGTKVKFECAPFYEFKKSVNQECYYSTWDHINNECVATCGRVDEGKHPWQGALYSKNTKELLCGLTLISSRLLLTAAHCVTDQQGTLKSHDLFHVGVGKRFHKYNDPRDSSSAQFSEVQELFIPNHNNRSSFNYTNEIVVVITKKSFIFSKKVLPVCIDWESRYSGIPFDPSKEAYGYINGWGSASQSKSSQELQEVTVTSGHPADCLKPLLESSDFDSFSLSQVAQNKVCVDYVNQGNTTCYEDLGGGLLEKHDDKYYLIGVYSLNPATKTEKCDTQSYKFYTVVQNYVESIYKIKSQVDSNQDPAEGCIVPQKPKNGHFQDAISNLQVQSGDYVFVGTRIRIICQDNLHKIDGSSEIECNNGEWSSNVPDCLAACPPLVSTSSTKVTCSSGDCLNSTHGTIATFQCEPYYENFDINRNPFRVCHDGSWGLDIPTCNEVCGLKTELSPSPWKVAIFQQVGNKTNFKCLGTLVNNKIILTVAQCVSDANGQMLQIEQFRVVAGNTTKSYDQNTFNSQQVQHSELEDVFFPEDYKGNIRRYRADIAIIVTKKSFNMTDRVLLACVDWDNKFTQEFDYQKNEAFISPSLGSNDNTEVKLTFLSDNICYEQLLLSSNTSNFDYSYYTYDKLCSKYMNSDQVDQCELDRGVGLMTKNARDNRYYLIGIASIFPSLGAEVCNNQWILFTQVSKHLSNFINEKYKLYTPVNSSFFQSTVCGVRSVQAQTLVVNGQTVQKGEYPWQVAIYKPEGKKIDLICGGSIINPRIILTAAHCVSNLENGDIFSPHLFTVAVGKYYRNFSDPRDTDAQFSKIIKIFVPSQYQGELQNFVADIAVLISEKSFVLSRKVQPVCVDWDGKYEAHILRSTATGFVSGWGYTQENSNPSQVLKDLEVPYVEKDECKDKIPSDYDIYLTFDKMCSGYLNRSKSVCRGDSGGALVFKNTIDGRYYITGIVSLSPQGPTGGCHSQQYSLYTKVSHYVKEFVLEKAQLYWR